MSGDTVDSRDTATPYPHELQLRLNDATKRCVMDCRIGDPWSEAKFYPAGVVEAFAYMREVAPCVYLPYSGAVVWTPSEFLTVCELVGEMG